MNKSIIMIIIILFTTLFASVLFADEIEKLNAQKQQIDFQLIKTAGQDELNNQLIREAAGRSLTISQRMTKLRQQLSQVNKAIKNLEMELEDKKE